MIGKYYMGVDMPAPGSKDRTVITKFKKNKKGQLVLVQIDEIGEWPNYKWWRNPIKWYKWRKMMQGIMRQDFPGVWRQHNDVSPRNGRHTQA